MDFESQLIWPDSEELFQTIASFDDTNQFPFSFAGLPLSMNVVQTPVSFDSPASFDERRGVPSLATEGEQAVWNLSQLVSSVVSKPVQLLK
jgi:hypothetical protein